MIILWIVLELLVMCMVYGWGHEDGYKKGQRECDRWWCGLEEGADEARQEIWREEGSRQ